MKRVSYYHLESLFSHLILDFIEAYHKQKINSLIASLSQETWVPADIPDKYLDYFALFFDPQYNMDNDDINNGYDNTEDILKSSRPSISSKDSEEFDTENEEEEEKEKNGQIESNTAPKGRNSEFSKEEEGNGEKFEKKKLNFVELSVKAAEPKRKFLDIMKNEIFINNKKYRLTSSFLLLVKIIYDFLHIAQKFRFSGSITITRLFDIIKYYSSFSCQLILGAGAIPLGVIKMITAKILGI